MRPGIIILGIVLLIIGIFLLAFTVEAGEMMYGIMYLAGVTSVSSFSPGEMCSLLFRIIAFSSFIIGLVCLLFGILSEPRAHSSI